MANRVTGDEVKNILETIRTSDQIEHYITAANLIVTEDLVGQGMSDERLKLIELYLSAHFVAIDDQRFSSHKDGEASASFMGASSIGKGLELTFQGQQALVLDSSGILRSKGKKQVSFDVMGPED